MVRLSTRETMYIDCLKPVGEKSSILKIKWIHVCQCTEYRSREQAEEVNLPSH